MTPRAKVHDDGTLALLLFPGGKPHKSRTGPWHVIHVFGQAPSPHGDWLHDETVSGPGWRDAAVAPADVLVAAIADAIGKGVDAEAAGDQVDPDAIARSLVRSLSAAAWAERPAESC